MSVLHTEYQSPLECLPRPTLHRLGLAPSVIPEVSESLLSDAPRTELSATKRSSVRRIMSTSAVASLATMDPSPSPARPAAGASGGTPHSAEPSFLDNLRIRITRRRSDETPQS